ncbi:uncharacterized protein N7506_005732 [Penicillium brevicompactum]|uniref:uncharacterized protein n=1 Tax=Penicillium brevicompactum TaxID=5074 RepID=UPI0025409383|nr:uncharacterized protein N7506_005676 [Penicillium brevicompactum]XP_056812002.1 uncharacterized protein N7506_005732 [Penicillium brevicompactum]KAJ5335740.1 hypothetical protein N7506_005676 [Penicillium brevicompactum]KAJ5335796.1 hypothetical protein N7506_005732 [Penicillium brevicompactum]
MSTISSSPTEKKGAQKKGTMGLIPVLVNGQPYMLMHERTRKTIKDGVKIYGGPHSLAGPGGAADAGETPDDAIIRETQEEYGLEVTIVPVQGKKVFAKTNNCLSNGSFWCCNFYLLELNDKKQVPQIPQQEQKKATRLVAVPSYALQYLGEVISVNDDANKGGDANEDRIEVKLKTDTVYFFESLKNLARVHRELCMDELSGFWDIVSEIPEYQADELIGHGIDIIE